MDKPVLLIREDFINDIVKLINASKLPLVLIEPVLEDILNDTRIGLKNQYEQEKKEYETYLLNQNMENKAAKQNIDEFITENETENITA